MAIQIQEISELERQKVLAIIEGHFSDVKSCQIAPAKLTKHISAFSNAEGGELYIGIAEDKISRINRWSGFAIPEDANGHLQAFETLFPLGDGYSYTFLQSPGAAGLVLKVEIAKSKNIKAASDNVAYLRRGAQSLPVNTSEAIALLRRNKGLISFESETVAVPVNLVTNSTAIIEFMLEVIPTAEPDAWLRKQLVVVDERPTVAGIILFADEPQAALPKRSGIKIYRYKTSAQQGTRDALAFDPISIEGNAYLQIQETVRRAVDIVESVRVNTPEGLESIKYPETALHEIITNAVLHRDYSIADDIHIRIFDNRIEVSSPGTLPAHITPQNILEERFSRNATVVRLINKFPNAPNKDVGEGLNTAFLAMREMKLKPPVISQTGGYVTVILRHEPLASPEEIILEYLQKNTQITNRIARELCFIGSENKMKGILQRLVKRGLIELVPGTTRYSAAYRLIC